MFNTTEWIERMERTMIKLYDKDKYIQPVIIVLEMTGDERGHASFFIDASRYISEEETKDKLRSRLVRTCAEKDVEGLILITEGLVSFYDAEEEDTPFDDFNIASDKEGKFITDSEETLMRLGLDRKKESIVMFQWETKYGAGIKLYSIADKKLQFRSSYNNAETKMGGRFFNILFKPNLN